MSELDPTLTSEENKILSPTTKEAKAISKSKLFVKTDEYIALELMVHKDIEGSGITIDVLALIEDDHSDQVVGYVGKYIQGNAATKNDLPACIKVLEAFHAWGYAHCDVHPKNFIITPGKAYLTDLHSAVKVTAELAAADIESIKEFF